MSEEHLEPAASIIAKVGVQAIADVVGKHPSRIYRWRMSKDRGGTGGYVPHEDAEKLRRHEFEGGVRFEEKDFFLPLDADRFDQMFDSKASEPAQ